MPLHLVLLPHPCTTASTAAQQLNALFSPVGNMSMSVLALLSSGPLMLDIEKIYFAKDTSPVAGSSSSTTPKFHVMLGHDITICPLMASLRVRGCDGAPLSHQWPAFAR